MGMMFIMLANFMQQLAQKWAWLIFATGGSLNLMKCFWYGIQWHFTPDGTPKMKKIQDGDPEIMITPGNNPVKTLCMKRVEVTKGMRTLGV